MQENDENTLTDIAHLDGRFYQVKVEEITPEQFADAAEETGHKD